MFLLLPTCNAYASIAGISLGLLRRYWPGHPPVHVLHHESAPKVWTDDRIVMHDRGPQRQSSWLSNMVGFLQTRREEMFLLLLDDYALCGPARVEVISAGHELMVENPSIGLFPLCWYPAARRVPRPRSQNMVTLTGTPILLQAAIWRRTWFLELASHMHPHSSPWGFEAAATQWAKKSNREICSAQMPEPSFHGGHLVDGFDKTHWPLPYHNLMHSGALDRTYEPFLRTEGFELPSLGLGDTIAKLAQASGAAAVAGAISRITGRDCGCEERRRKLNRSVPYQR
jgi:hypothetical protein